MTTNHPARPLSWLFYTQNIFEMKVASLCEMVLELHNKLIRCIILSRSSRSRSEILASERSEEDEEQLRTLSCNHDRAESACGQDAVLAPATREPSRTEGWGRRSCRQSPFDGGQRRSRLRLKPLGFATARGYLPLAVSYSINNSWSILRVLLFVGKSRIAFFTYDLYFFAFSNWPVLW